MSSTCGEFEWSPIAAAPSQSQLAGLLASLVFAGIVLLLSIQSERGQRTNALLLFGAAFFTLGYDSFAYSAAAGEQDCARGWTTSLLAAGLLGLGTLSIFSAICWLIDHGDNSRQVVRLFLVITYA